MEKVVVSVYDKKIGMYAETPFVVRHNGEAIREWDIVRKKPDTKYGANPEDFDLFQIGTYNEKTGLITPITPHVHLASGV